MGCPMEQSSQTQPLSDLRVIDLTHGIAGPYCTKLLADFGADVIKVERPGTGDWSRSLGPFPGDVPHPEKSGLFLHLNTNKRSVALDLKTRQGVEVVKELIRDADVLAESFRPGVMERLGLGYEVLSKINPNLVMTSLSNFGQTGPYRDYLASELVLFAMGGRMSNTGLLDRYPLKLGGNHVQYQAGNVAAMASLFAWFQRLNQGAGGQQVDVSIFETQMGSINGRMADLIQYQYCGERGQRLGEMRGGYPSGYYPTQDGYANLGGGGINWPKTVAMLGMPELLKDPRFAPPAGQQSMEGKEEFEGTIFLPWLMERTKAQVVAECQKYAINAGPVNTMAEVADDNPHTAARNYFVEIDHPVAGKFRYPGAPIFNNNGWWRIRRPAPLLGQHTEEVFAELKTRPRPAAPAITATAPARGNSSGGARLPLEGVRVVDMTVVWAGPYGTMFLADMGAEVIRVESVNICPTTTRGQSARPPKEVAQRLAWSYPNRDPGQRPWNRATIFNIHGRNKYSMTVDVNTPEGKDIVRRLVQTSDLFVQNNGVGSMERLGLTWDVLRQWNPRISMINSTGFGYSGPWSEYRGTGGHFEAAYGHASVIGYPDMDVEGVPSSVASDASTGVTVALASLLALAQARKTGKSAYVDIAMGENFLPHLGELLMDYTINGRVAERLGNRDPHLVQGAYPCAGDNEWVTISIGAVQQWHALCKAMGRPELAKDPRFADMKGLHAHHDEVDTIISAWTADKDPIALFHRLQGAGIPSGPVLHEIHAYNDPHVKAREFFVEITQADCGTHLYPSVTFRLPKAPFAVRKPPVRLGEDNDYVYRDVLKVSEQEYNRLKALGQIGTEYAPHVT
ncbi:MAG: CoA transferase [Dehalococcoidia bacterium]|nr:CoA transferase [Dehalococcoidia bacterium]